MTCEHGRYVSPPPASTGDERGREKESTSLNRPWAAVGSVLSDGLPNRERHPASVRSAEEAERPGGVYFVRSIR